MSAATHPVGARSRPRLAAVLLAAFLSVIGVVVVVPPAPAQAVTDFPLEGEWSGFPWNKVMFVGSSGYLPNACGPRQAFRGIRKVGVNHYVGEVAMTATGSCPSISGNWVSVDLTIGPTGTQLFSKAPNWTTSYVRVGGLPQSCPPLTSVTRHFANTFTDSGTVFSVSFTNLNYCYDWKNVWFRDNPQFRIYVAGTRTMLLQGACVGVSKTDTGVKLPSIYVTCNAVFSNRDWTALKPKAQGDADGTSLFTIPGYLNAGLTLGTAGFVNGPVTADQTRFFTLRLYANGCHNMSGIGNSTLTCP